jgi:hypothetical protein
MNNKCITELINLKQFKHILVKFELKITHIVPLLSIQNSC